MDGVDLTRPAIVRSSKKEWNADRKEHLADVPSKYLSGDDKRPLLSRNTDGSESRYALHHPVLLEASWQAIVNTMMFYLEGAFNPNWSSGMTMVQAGQFVSSSLGIMFTTPFIGAIIADTFLGN